MLFRKHPISENHNTNFGKPYFITKKIVQVQVFFDGEISLFRSMKKAKRG
jgi:hypothetical protein